MILTKIDINEDFEEGTIHYPEFRHAIIGRNSRDGSVVYDEDKVMDILVTRMDISPQDAYEHFSYNVLGNLLGEGTPTFIKKF